MTPTPEATKETTKTEYSCPEGKPKSWITVEGMVKPTAEVTAEPQPAWSTAIKTWGVAWEFHQYGLGACFGIIGFLALITFFKTLKNNRSNRQKKVSLVVVIQITIFGLSRCFFLCADAYNSKGHLSALVVNLIWGIGHPCLATAFMLIFLVLRNALVMKRRFQSWYTTRNIALFTIPYYLFVFASEMIVSFLPTYKGLTYACQIIHITLYISLASFYSYISLLTWGKFRLVRKESPKTKQRQKQTLAIFKHCIATTVGGFCIGAMQIYTVASINTVPSNKTRYISPWPWFAFITSLRCIELGMSVLLYMTGTQNAAGQQALNKVTPMSMTLSEVGSKFVDDPAKSETYQILRINFQYSYVKSEILPLTGAVQFQ